MSDSTPSPKPKGGCLKKIVFFLILALAGAIIYSFLVPQDLSDIAGYESPAERAEWKVRERPEDIRQLIQQAAATNTPVTLTEEQINEWLLRNIVLDQDGALNKLNQAEALWVRLHPERIEIIIERSLHNPKATPEQKTSGQDQHPHNLSLFLDIKKSDKGITIDRAGGKFGNLPFSGLFKGYQVLVIPGFNKIADHFKPELELIQNSLTDITVEEGQVTLKKLEARRIVK